MLEGIVTEDGSPEISVEIARRSWRAIIYTRFNGELELSEQLRSELNPRFVGRVTSLLAADQLIEEDVYLVDFPFDGQSICAQATFCRADEILIGTQSLRNHRLQIDFLRRMLMIDRGTAIAASELGE